MNEQAHEKFVGLLRTAAIDLKSMLHLDGRLLRAEFGAKAAIVRAGSIWGIATLILSSFSLFLVFQGLVFLLIWQGLPAYVACMVVAAVLGFAALICGLKARTSVVALTIVPERTMAAVRKDVATLKGALFDAEP